MGVTGEIFQPPVHYGSKWLDVCNHQVLGQEELGTPVWSPTRVAGVQEVGHPLLPSQAQEQEARLGMEQLGLQFVHSNME